MDLNDGSLHAVMHHLLCINNFCNFIFYTETARVLPYTSDLGQTQGSSFECTACESSTYRRHGI